MFNKSIDVDILTFEQNWQTDFRLNIYIYVFNFTFFIPLNFQFLNSFRINYKIIYGFLKIFYHKHNNQYVSYSFK